MPHSFRKPWLFFQLHVKHIWLFFQLHVKHIDINFFLFLHESICCEYWLEAPQGGGGASNEYPQHMFSCRNKKNIYLIPTHLDLWYAVLNCPLNTELYYIYPLSDRPQQTVQTQITTECGVWSGSTLFATHLIRVYSLLFIQNFFHTEQVVKTTSSQNVHQVW